MAYAARATDKRDIPHSIQEYNASHRHDEDVRDATSLLREVRLAHNIKRKKRTNIDEQISA